MDLIVNLSEVLLLIGLFLAVIISIAFGIKAHERVANIWFTGFLVASAVVFAVKLLYSTGQIVNYPHWFKLNYPAGILRPVFFYLYISYLLNNSSRIDLRHLLHFIPFTLLCIYLVPFFLMDGAYKIDVLSGRASISIGKIPGWYLAFQYVYSISYLVLVFISLRTYIKNNPRPNRKKKELIKWIRLMLFTSISFIFIAFLIRVMGLSKPYNIYVYDLYSILLILLSIRLMTLPEIVASNSPQINKYEKSPLSAQDITDILNRINVLMAEQQYYKRRNLKLSHLSKELELPAYQISQVINQSTGQSFAYFINNFRVEAAKTLMLEDRSRYTIEGIGHEAGFKSRASFYTAFKKHTGLTPSEFLKK